MTVEVCPICDIAGCKHIREKTHPMTHDTPPKRITLEEAQAAVDPRLVAEILRDFGTNFDGVYPVGVLARGVGPEQSMIGLAIKRGHLVTRSHADAMVAAALREAAKIAVRHWEGEEEDSLVMCEAILTLIPQPDAAAPRPRPRPSRRPRRTGPCEGRRRSRSGADGGAGGGSLRRSCHRICEA